MNLLRHLCMCLPSFMFWKSYIFRWKPIQLAVELIESQILIQLIASILYYCLTIVWILNIIWLIWSFIWSITIISSIFDPLFDPIFDPFFIHYFIHYCKFIQIVEKGDILIELFVDYYLVIIRWIIWSINYRSMLNSIVWLKSFKWWTFYLSWLTIIWLLFDDYSINRVIWFIHWLFEHWLKFSFKFFILLFQHS